MRLLLDFRKGLYIFLSRSKVISKKFTVFRIVLTTIDNPHVLNTLTILTTLATLTFIQIFDDDFSIIMQARKTLICGDEDFDVPMGCFDGAKICELVGTYIQSKLTIVMNKKEVGLYRVDGLCVLKNISRPEVERKKKAIVKVFYKMRIIHCG